MRAFAFSMIFAWSLLLTVLALEVKLGVEWSLCDLQIFHQLEYAFAIDESKAWNLLLNNKPPQTSHSNFESDEDDKNLYVLMKESNYYAAKAQLYTSVQPSILPCDTFFWDGHKHSCDQLIDSPKGEFEGYDFDHQYGTGKAQFILYSTLNSPPKLANMLSAAMQSNLPFVFRPIMNSRQTCKDFVDWVDLSAGVTTEFEAKNEEYANQKAKKKDAKIVLPPELEHIGKVKTGLEIDYKIPLSEINEMALKMAQAVFEAKEEQKLSALETIISNYPVLQKTLNQIKLKKSFIAIVEKQHKQHPAHLNLLRINNMDVNMDIGSWYSWLQLGLEFRKLALETKLSVKAIGDLFGKQDEAISKTIYKLDPEGVIYFNDLEKDPLYAQWPRSLDALLNNQPTPPQFGSLKLLRRNLVTAIVYVPINHPQFIEILSDWSKTVHQSVPMRMGFQVTVGTLDPKDMEQFEKSELMVKVFYKLQRSQTIQDAFKFAVQVLTGKKMTCDESLAEVSAKDKTTCQEYAQDYELPKNAYLMDKLMLWINGKLSTYETLHDMISKLIGLYHKEINRFIEAVMEKSLNDDSDIHEFIFDEKKYQILSGYLRNVEYTEMDTKDKDILIVNHKCPKGFKCKKPPNVSSTTMEDTLIFNGRKVLLHPRIDLEEHAKILATCILEDDATNPQLLIKLNAFKAHIKKVLHPMVSESDGKPIKGQKELMISLGEPTKNTLIHVQAVMSPTSRHFPKTLLILLKLKQAGLVCGHLYLNPPVRINDYPFRDFYSITGQAPKLTPKQALLSVKMEAPVNWIIVQRQTSEGIDVDNVRLQNTKQEDTITFALKHLVLEGQFLDQTRTTPGAGIQLQLLSNFDEGKNQKKTKIQDQTIVMANYGYFQLKCAPGIYSLTDKVTYQLHAKITVDSFTLPMIPIKAKLPENWHQRIMNQVSRKSNEDREDGGDEDKGNDINIFSIASGIPYERLIRIMMTSVAKQKKDPKRRLKFWLFDSYVSPHFRDCIRRLQSKLNFECEFISYKWPTWLIPQRSKMHKIWAYKILFLDVLFPLALKRVIFLDADQVARADLAELMDLDMQDQVYGMVPFCEDKPDMQPYRFWRTPGGYWDQYLQDLERLRATLTGDILRSQYQMLVNDPHSLSNLDQDLPNSLQHRVPIYSLPQEWLWCATWCSTSAKSAAKVIDLCNNPKTKEDKLGSARKIIPEWDTLDKFVEKIISPLDNQKIEL